MLDVLWKCYLLSISQLPYLTVLIFIYLKLYHNEYLFVDIHMRPLIVISYI